MIVFAFFAGAQKNPALGLMSFLCFFVMGAALMIEGVKKFRKKS